MTTTGWRRWFGDRRLRTKVLVPVILAVLGTSIVMWSGMSALTSASTRATALYTHTAVPLADLATVRDLMGDSRSLARDLAVSQPGSAQTDVLSQIKDTDQGVDAALAAYLGDHGGALDATRAGLLNQAHTALTAWRQVRDTQIATAAQHGDATTALQAVAGPLGQADNAFSDPMDKLFTQETSDAAATAAGVHRATTGSERTMLIVGLLAALLAVVIGLLVTRLITRPVGRVVAVLDHLAQGDLTHEAGIDSRDEIGAMARALDHAAVSMRTALTTVSATAANLDASSGELTAASAGIAAAAHESAGQAGAVSAAAEQITQNVSTLAAGSEEMGASIREIAHNSAEAAKVAAEAVTLGATTTTTIRKLDESSAQIGRVLNMITAIAEQTNLLALNATIEAARAGDAGKGFAVVASEVKDLAQETARATGEISQLITAIQADTGAAVEATARISEIVERVSAYQTTIASAVEEQTATTTEMSRNVTEVATGSRDISGQISGIAAQTAASTEGVGRTQQAAGHLARLSEELRLAVAHFTV